MLSRLIDQLSRDLGIEDPIKQGDDRHYLISLDDDIEVKVMGLDKSHLLKGIIGKCPEQNVESFLMKVMEGNLFGMGTRGGVIGLHEEGKLLTLSMELDYNSSYKDFQEKMEDFVSVLDFWRQEALKHN
ncbi:MAG: type III secretion system chaperone [Parachlamydiaceae bacterium]